MLAALLSAALTDLLSAQGKKYKSLTNQQVIEMLDTVERDIKDNYYDPAMHGLDIAKRFQEAREKIATAKSQDEGLLHIAGALAALKDSHTHFRPPVRPYGVDYGWIAQAVGDSSCYVTAVRPESDAAAKGLKAGDQLVSINGVRVLRENIAAIEYGYRVFPQSGFHLIVRSPEGVERAIVPLARILPGQPQVSRSDFMEWLRHYQGERDRSRYHKLANKTLIWKLPDFVVDPGDVDGMLDKLRSYDTVILDLRGNPGGLEEAGTKFIGGLLSHDVKVGDRTGRKALRPVVAKSRGSRSFNGKVVVLIDSKTASAAEILARVVQLEKRGIVLGDRSAGAVTEAQFFEHTVQLDGANVTPYGTLITVADLTMTDGKSLEGVGVTPDERILPTALDLAEGRDPVLARAAEIAGIRMTPEEAGKILPFEWPKAQMPEIGLCTPDAWPAMAFAPLQHQNQTGIPSTPIAEASVSLTASHSHRDAPFPGKTQAGRSRCTLYLRRAWSIAPTLRGG
jgi:carboxyl-terminal processing protease